MRKKYNLLIGERMAEQIKIAIGSAYPLQTELTTAARGRNLITGLPGSIEVSSIEIRDAMSNSIQIIIDTIRDALDEVPPELVSDLLDNGVCLAGGGSQILGLVPRLRDELNLRVWMADDPMTCVARGTGIFLDNLPLYEKFIVDLDQIHN
jgi:rod shape-determining protein MreB